MKDVLHKRILIVVSNSGYKSQTTVEEVKVLELSPSGKWVKLQNSYGQKIWRMAADVNPIEILETVTVN